MRSIASSLHVLSAIMALLFLSAIAVARESIELASADLLDVTLILGDQRMADDVIRETDENNDGVLDAKEMGALRWLIEPRRFDLNRNDRLTSLEIAIHFANMRKQFAITVPDMYNATRMINQYDRNGDRMLTDEEARSFPMTSDIATIDANRDGRLTPFELGKQLAADFQDLGVEALDQWNALQYIRKNDKDADQQLSPEEDRADAGKLLKLYDKNMNGFIDLNELVADRSAVGILDEDIFLEFESDVNQKMSRMEIATYLSEQCRNEEAKRAD